MDYTVKETTKEELSELYKESALTLEGLSSDSIPDFVNWLKELEAIKAENITVYVTKGSLMNSFYHLTGRNKYCDDLSLVSVKNSDIFTAKVVIPRFSIGGRWFDDIVDNNNRREKEKGNIFVQ